MILPSFRSFAVEAGTMLNGVAYAGAPEPWLPQQANEFTVNRIDPSGNLTFVCEHDHGLGSGAYDRAAAPFAFYYDTIAFAAAPTAIDSDRGGRASGPGSGASDGDGGMGMGLLHFGDRSQNDSQREFR